MRFRGINIRLVAGLAMTIIFGYWLATARIAHIAPASGAFGDSTYGGVHLNLSPAGLGSSASDIGKDALVFKQALATESYLPLWYGTIPLRKQGESTTENVSIAAQAIDGITLHPNEVFSFNSLVGIRSEEKGYQPGLMYSQGEVVTGVGGGICIVSTLLYRGALESGLKIIERHPHSGPVSYADPGRDAAVSFGMADMCFKNTTGQPLLIRANVEDDELTISFYGPKKLTQTVEVVSKDYEELPYKIIEQEDPTVPEGQVVVDRKARKGFIVTTVRLIKENGKLVQREVISHDTILPQDKLMRIPPKPQEIEPLNTVSGTAAQPQSSGLIHVPESTAPQPSATQPQSAVPAPPETPGLNLSTSDRTNSTARE